MDTELKAPKGKFRVVGVDTFPIPPEDYLIGDFDNLEAAKLAAQKVGGEMSMAYVYSENGINVFKAGSF